MTMNIQQKENLKQLGELKMTKEEKRGYHREYAKKYYRKNKEKISEQHKKYVNSNRDEVKEYQKKWRQKNKGKVREYMREWMKTEKRKEYENTEEYKIKKKEYLKEYRRLDKFKLPNNSRNCKRRAKIKDTDITTNWLLNLKAVTTHCGICGRKLKDPIHLDHIIPLNVGGLHTKSNVRYVHAKCNLSRPKNGSDIIQFKLSY